MSTNENTLEATSIDIPLPSDLRYGYRSFIDELKVLEEVYYPSIMDRNLTQSIANQYSFLLARVRNYASYGKKLSENNELSNLENKDITILNYVHSTILSRLNQLKSTDSTDLIIDILGFIEIVKSNMDNLVQQKQIEKIDFYKKGYESQIERKIAEANSFIQQLQTAIEQYYKEIDDAFKELLTETEELKVKAEKDVQKLNEKKEKLEKQLPLKMLFGSLKVLTSVLAFTGPQGALAGSLINSGTNIAQAFTLNDNDGKKLPLSSIPEGAESFIKKWGEYSKDKKEEIKKLAKERMKEIDDLLKDKPKELLSPSLKEVEKRREDVETELKKLSDDGAEYDPAVLMKKCDLQQDLVNALKDEKKAHNERSEIEDQEYQKRTEWLEKAEKIANIVSAGVEIYNTYKEHEAAIDEIDEAISKNQETVEKFNKFEGKVNTFSQGTIVNMKVSVTSLERSLSTKSHIALDVSKWQMQTNLKDIKHELDKMTAGFAAQSEFIHVFEKVSDAIATLVGIYDRIQNYQEQAQLVDYIANVSSAAVTVDSPEINELKIIILQNTILERYSTLISAVKQWAFPFADRFFNDFNFMLGIDSSQSINENTERLKEIIKILEGKLRGYNNSIKSMDKKIVQTSFGMSDSKIPPFFIWESAQYAKTINTLFQESGKGNESEEVILISSVQASLFSAVKFNKIELRIRHKDQDPKKQKELDSCLDNFNVYLTHSTDSHYKFNNKFYKFGRNVDVNNSNEELQLLYGFKKNSNDSPFTKNIAYEKLANGELMLSPYSMWRVKLTLVNPKGKNYFSDLEKYSKFVNLELVGTGSYVDEGNMKDDEKGALLVDSYYESDDMFPIIADPR